MHVDSRGQGPVLLAANLVNNPVETPAGLELVCRAAGVVVEQPATYSDVVQLNDRLAAWQQLADESDVSARVAMLNHLLDQSVVGAPTLTMHNDQPLHLHYREDGVSLWQSLEAMILVGTAMHFVSRGATRLGRCAEPACLPANGSSLTSAAPGRNVSAPRNAPIEQLSVDTAIVLRRASRAPAASTSATRYTRVCRDTPTVDSSSSRRAAPRSVRRTALLSGRRETQPWASIALSTCAPS